MFTIYPQIANRLRSKVATLRTIAYDYGQLASPEEAYPMDYPAVLISVESAKWNEVGQKVQKGSLVIAVTVAIQPTIFKTGQSSPEIHKYQAMMQPVNDVFKAIRGYKGGETINGIEEDENVEIQGSAFTGMLRTDTLRMKRYDNIQAYTHLFKCEITDESAQPVYVKHPTPPEIKMYTPNTVLNFPEDLE